MVRLSRVEQQQRNRAKVLAAARQEFLERGYSATRVDAIAERAELTRGAVYSNFPGKRALYFAVLAELAERWQQPSPEPGEPHPGEPHPGPAAAAAAYVRAWFARPTMADQHGGRVVESGGSVPGCLGFELLSEVAADELTRVPFAQLCKLNAILLGLGLERTDSPAGSVRRVRVAETVLTTLYGAQQLTVAAPGFVGPFDLVESATRLVQAAMRDEWAPPHFEFAPSASEVDLPWTSITDHDMVGNRLVTIQDGVIAVLGLRRLAAMEEAVRAAPSGMPVTVVVVTGDPTELGPLARLLLAEGCGCLRRALPETRWPRARVLLDLGGMLAAAVGVATVDDETERAILVREQRVIATAEGRGAGHAVASLRPRSAASGPGSKSPLR